MPELDKARIAEAMGGLVAPIQELDGELEREEQRLGGELEAVRAERRRLRAVLKAAEMTHEKPGPKVGRPKAGEGVNPESYTISEERLTVIGALIADREGEFCVSDLVSETGINNDAFRRAFHHFRDRGQIRQVRVGGRTHQTRYFVTTAKGMMELAPQEANGAPA